MHLESHANVAERVAANSASLVVFNLGYLPGADHAVCTSPASTVPALEASMQVRLHNQPAYPDESFHVLVILLVVLPATAVSMV